MRRFLVPLLIVGCLSGLTGYSFSAVLFRNEQFAYRDAAHYYYPLHQLVQEEWNAGRWPLWEPEENAGMPLLGNPTAAVLYPGKILFAFVPYAWGARLYVIAHTLLAFGAMLALMRSWEVSWIGSTLSGLAYAFGAPILFQYCNIIFLVGAAWTPLGFRAVDRWLRLGRRFGLLELAVVLAMQTLGGDPESSYVTGVCAGGYALGLTWLECREPRRRRWRGWQIGLVLTVLAVGWSAAVIGLSAIVPAYRPKNITAVPLPWMPWVPLVVTAVWVWAGFVVLVRWLRNRRGSVLMPRLAGLAGAALLAGGLGAAQLLPVFEYTRQSIRAAGSGPHDIYPFSLEPFRAVELVWPSIFGTHFEGNRSWLEMISPAVVTAKVWIPSLYLGGLTLVLSLSVLGFRGGPPWRGWLSAIAIVTFIASMGEYTGPNWWARFDPSLVETLGPHDTADVTAIRQDRCLRDGDGGVYWTLATVLPGFRQFRFPSKLLSFTVLALAGLAGIGWDGLLREGRSRAPTVLASLCLVPSAIGLPLVLVFRARLVDLLAHWKKTPVASPFGPFDAPAAVAEIQRSMTQAVLVYAVALVIVRMARHRPRLAGVLALLALTGDLAAANSRYIITAPQSVFEGTPEVARIIEEAERTSKEPSPRPFRIHRMPIWNPMAWGLHSAPNRVTEFVEWERATLQPKYGIPLRIQYTMTMGFAELYDYDWFFGGFLRTLSPEMARQLNAPAGEKIVVYPRRAFDLWNSRYFVIPAHPNQWTDEHRGFAAFLGDIDTIYPDPSLFKGPDGPKRQREWVENHDFQVYRNRHCYPRAWVVHQARPIKSIVGLERADRVGPMEEILFENDHFWYNPDRPIHDPRQVAWVDEADMDAINPFLSGGVSSASETVTVTHYSPQRVELEADLVRPGLVVLADVYYPGWRLTIDGHEAPIHRANRLMRGAGVPSGKHHLVFTYDPRSFRIGGNVTLASLATLGLLGLLFGLRPVSTGLETRIGDER